MKKKDSKKEEKMEKMAKGGCAKGYAAGGSAKARKGGFPGIKKAPLPAAKKK